MALSSPFQNLRPRVLALAFSFLRVVRTKSCVYGGLGAARFSDHDGCVGVVLFHGGIASSEEVPVVILSLRSP